MKKFISVTLSLLLLTSVLASCTEMNNESTTNGTGTEETTRNLPVSGSENSSEELNNTSEQSTSGELSFG